MGNSIVGILGGGLGGQILAMVGGSGATVAATGGTDMAAIITSVVSGGVGGGVLVAIVGAVKNAMAKS